MRSKKSSLGPILSFVEVAQNRGWKYVPCMIVQNSRIGGFDINNQHIYIIDSQLGSNEIYPEDLGEVDD